MLDAFFSLKQGFNKEKEESNQKDLSKDKKNEENKDNKDNKDKKLEKKKKREYKIFYSLYGYIKVEKSQFEKNEPVVKFIQFRPVPFRIEDCLFGKINTVNCINEINIQVKTFYNDRLIHLIEKIDIMSSLQLVIKRMFEQERKEREKKEKGKKDKEKNEKEKEKNENEKEKNEKEKNENEEEKNENEKEKNENEKEKDEKKEDNNNKEKKEKTESEYEEEILTEQSQYRIFSCHKQIHELNPTRNIFENDIQDNELLLYLPIKKLSFSEYVKGDSIIVSQEGKIASKVNIDAPQYILGNIGYSFGKHYFEVNLLTEPIAQSVIIGLATKRNPADMFLYDVHNFYGYILSDMQKVANANGKQEKKDYSLEPITINDIIGVLFEFKKDGLEISFYKNKIYLGVAFNKLFNDKIFFPAVSLGLMGSKVQISNQIDFP